MASNKISGLLFFDKFKNIFSYVFKKTTSPAERKAIYTEFQSNKKFEILTPIILTVLVLIFLSPLYIGFEGICTDDAMLQSFSKLMAVARA